MQVILYTLMSSDRYHSDSGLLLYLKTGSLHPVVASHMDRRGNAAVREWKGPDKGRQRSATCCRAPVETCRLVISELLKLRNTLVHYVHRCVRKEAERSRLSALPDILTNRQTCQFCPQSFNCALYERCVCSPWSVGKTASGLERIQKIAD